MCVVFGMTPLPHQIQPLILALDTNSNPYCSLWYYLCVPAEMPRFLLLKSPSLAHLAGPQGVPRLAERCSSSKVSWAFLGVSYRWDIPRTPLQATSFGHLYPRSRSFGHYPKNKIVLWVKLPITKLMTIDRPGNRELLLSA